MRFKIDLKIFIFLILFIFTRQIETYATIMIFALIHEMGHLISGLLLGIKPNKLEIVPYGVRVSFKLNFKDYNRKIGNGNMLSIKKIIIALAGPLTNLIIILITFQSNYQLFSSLIIIYANILLIIFNLLPFYPLDGGRILKEILHIIFGKKSAERYINNISFITIMILTFISSILIYSTKNIAIFIIIIVLWCMFIKEDLIYKKRKKIYQMLEITKE